MSIALNCLICRPPELERLLQAAPAMEQVWLALPRQSLAPKQILHAAGDTLTRSWLVEQGLVRTYYLNQEGVERNRSFHAEGSWLGGGVPPAPSICPYTMEAMEPTQVVELPYATLQTWRDNFPAIRPLLQEAMNCLFTGQAQREAELLTLSPLERYQTFMTDQAAILARVPIHHVASYLGISNVSLSRIRARLGMANQGRSAA
jgi:CRP-like cAMP-binding protein